LFEELWTPKELAKIREIQARPPEQRNHSNRKYDVLKRLLDQTKGMSEYEVYRFIRKKRL
jgi:hypothetical protein